MPTDKRFKEIKKSELQRGDILWGGNFVNGKWEGHVAIYLGDGKTIEARVKEGVDYNKNRPYFTKVYRIVALYPEPINRVEAPKSKADVENVIVTIRGKNSKIKGYIVKGTTFIEVNGATIGVRKFFEALGFKVLFKDGRVIIE